MGIFTKLPSLPVAPRPQLISDAGKAKSLSLCSSAEARRLVDQQFAERSLILPLNLVSLFDTKVLNVACATSSTAELVAALRFSTGFDVRLIHVEQEILKRAIEISYAGDDHKLIGSLESLKNDAKVRPAEKPKLDIREVSGDVARFLNVLIEYAIAQDASDIHIAPRIDGTHLSLRIGGELRAHVGSVATSSQHRELINRVKVLARLDTTQHALPQDGSFVFPVAQNTCHVRVSVLPTVHGEKAVLRLLNAGVPRKLDELGLPEDVLSNLSQALADNEGMILFAGPTGSGKTTSMYAALQRLLTTNVSICSVEDPVEIHIAGIAQTSIDEKVGLSYSQALRAILRQDPDVVMVGEIRDTESAQVAFQASMTGHLMLSTVHARNALEVLSRLRVLGLDGLTVAQAVRLIVCQQLLPKLCACKVVDLQVSGGVGHDVFKPVGCPQCDYSGFSGQVLVTECLAMHDEVSRFLVDGRLAEIRLSESSGFYSSPEKIISELRRKGVIC